MAVAAENWETLLRCPPNFTSSHSSLPTPGASTIKTKPLCSGCRIVFVNSISECHGKVDWEDLQGFKPQHSDYGNYARSECWQGYHQL